MANAAWVLLWLVLLARCSAVYTTPAAPVTKRISDGPNPITPEPRGAAPRRRADELPLVQKFVGNIFVMDCSDRYNWTVYRNTSKMTRDECVTIGNNRREYGRICFISYLQPWDRGVYWCEHKDGMVANLRNLTVHLGVLLLQPSVAPIGEGDDVVLTCGTRWLGFLNRRDIVRFYKDDTLLADRSGRGQLTVPGFSASNAGFYKCAVKGFVSPIVWLEANGPAGEPITWRAPTSHVSSTNRLRSGSLSATTCGAPVAVNRAVILAGYDLVLRCNNAGNSSANMSVWGIRMPPHDVEQMCGDPPWGERIGPVCDIAAAFPWDSGFYFCKSADGESEAPLGLTVEIVRRRTPDRVAPTNRGGWEVPEGELIILTCKATDCRGRTWSVWMDTGHGVTRCGMRRGAVIGSACWLAVARPDSGVFWCATDDGYRGGQSALTVVPANTVIMDISPASMERGDDVVLKCAPALSAVLPNETVLFYKNNVLVATLPRGYMVIRDFSNDRHRGHYKCVIPGRGESQNNFLAEDAGHVCNMYDPHFTAVVRDTTTTAPAGQPRGRGLDGRIIAILCVIVPPILGVLYSIAKLLLRAIQVWRARPIEL